MSVDSSAKGDVASHASFLTKLRTWRPSHREYVLALLVVVFAIQYLDRQIVVVLAEPIKREFAITDAELGLLAGFVFSIPYSLMLLPVGMLVDRVNRRTLLATALALWSLMTVVTGFVRNLPQLMMTRAVIAAAESSNNPAALSLLADLYGKGRRATAIGIFYAGPAIATVFGFAVIGMIAERWGWRAAFWSAGVPGLLLAALLLFTTREPAREQVGAQDQQAVPKLAHTLRFVAQQRSVRHLMFAMTLTSIVNSGQIAWMTPLFMRVHGMSLVEAATVVSVAYGVVLTIGQLFGGAIVDRLALRDVAWIGRATGLCAILAGAAMLGATLTTTAWIAVFLLACWALPTGCQYGPVMGALQGLVLPRMRGVTNAMMSLLINLVGAGLGPLLIGALSDRFAIEEGDRSVALAMALVALLQFWAAAHFFACQRSLQPDMRRVEGAVEAV